jgi:hypothetical protein
VVVLGAAGGAIAVGARAVDFALPEHAAASNMMMAATTARTRRTREH